MSERDGYNAGHLVLAFLGGAAVGAVAALLLAPRTGAETREIVAERARGAGEQLTHVPDRLKAVYDEALNAARDAFNEARTAEANMTAAAADAAADENKDS